MVSAAVVREGAVAVEAVEVWAAHPVVGAPVYQVAPIEVVPIGHHHIVGDTHHGVIEQGVADMGIVLQLCPQL